MTAAFATDRVRTLHRIHRQLADLRERLAAGPRRIALLTRQLEEARGKRSAVGEAIKQAKADADRRQLQLRSAEAKIADLDGKLNTCKTNREYQLLTEQIAADRMAAQVQEDEILEALEEVDRIKATVPDADGLVEAIEKRLHEARQQVAAEVSTLGSEVQRVEAERARAETGLDPEFRETYDRVVKHKGEDGFAPAEGGSCGGCHQQFTSKMSSELLMGRAVMCRSCGRLLYTPESVLSG
jgi:predicted CXXCH cytochrome family protein